MNSQIIEVNGRRLQLVESIVFYRAAIFKKHHRIKVMDDRDTLKRLFNDKQWDALVYYENFYKEMLYSSNYESQFDLLNYPEKAQGMPDSEIYEMYFLVKEKNRITKRKNACSPKIKKKAKPSISK